jgi:hypothetical protein
MKHNPEWQDAQNRGIADAPSSLNTVDLECWDLIKGSLTPSISPPNIEHEQFTPTAPSVGKSPTGRDAAKSSRKKLRSTSSSSVASESPANMQVLSIKIDEEQNVWQHFHELLRIEKVEIEKKAAAEDRRAELMMMEERILSIDLATCNPTMRAFYAAKQKIGLLEGVEKSKMLAS